MFAIRLTSYWIPAKMSSVLPFHCRSSRHSFQRVLGNTLTSAFEGRSEAMASNPTQTSEDIGAYKKVDRFAEGNHNSKFKRSLWQKFR